MKQVLVLLALVVGIVSCQPENPTPANNPPAINTAEQMLVGEWQLIETWQYDPVADTVLQVIPPWGTDCGASFSNTPYNSVAPQLKYQGVWKGNCVPLTGAWSVSNDTLYFNYLPYVIVYLGGDTLIVKDHPNQNHHLHFRKI